MDRCTGAHSLRTPYVNRRRTDAPDILIVSLRGATRGTVTKFQDQSQVSPYHIISIYLLSEDGVLIWEYRASLRRPTVMLNLPVLDLSAPA